MRMEVELSVLAFSRHNISLVAIISAIAVVLALSIAIQVSGARPYGEQAILEQIEHEDGALCGRFGLAIRTPQFADCMIALADLRQRHVELLTSNPWL